MHLEMPENLLSGPPDGESLPSSEVLPVASPFDLRIPTKKVMRDREKSSYQPSQGSGVITHR